MAKKHLSKNPDKRNSLFRNLFRCTNMFVLSFLLTSGSIHAGVLSEQENKVSLEKNNVRLEQIIHEIESQSGYLFIYSGDVDIKREYSLNVRQQGIRETLQELFGNSGIKYRIDGSYIVLSKDKQEAAKQSVTQASRRISGKVVDAEGRPVIGANVVEKGTGHGVITDVDGRFSLEVPEKAVLQISYIGYVTQEIPVRNRKDFSIVLEDDTKLLDEVVVVGYGTQKKVSVTGSVVQIQGKELLKNPVSNISSMLTGRLPGITSTQVSGQPGSDDASILVRGFSTTGNNAPIILVDGVQRSYNQLDPYEIESVTILKDASAAAVYGMQAANGVILVTTRKGVAQKTKITYSTSFSANENTAFPKFLDGPQYAYYYNKAREMDGRYPLFTEEDVNKMRNGDPSGKLGNTNWLDEIFQTGHTQHHNIAVNGGNENVKYYVMAGYYNQKGNIKNFDFERYNIRSNVDANITKNLSLSLDIGARLEERKAPALDAGQGGGIKGSAYSYSILRQAVKALPFLPKEYEGIPTGSKVNPIPMNPIAARDLSGYNNTTMAVLQSNLSLKWNIPHIRGLHIKAMLSYDHDYTYGKNFKNTYELMGADITQLHTDKFYTKNNFQAISRPSLTESMGRASRFTGQYSINYANTFGDHDVTGLFLYEHSDRRFNKFHVSGIDLDILGLEELDLMNKIGDIGKGFGGESKTSPRAGYVGRITYAYKQKYLAELSGRYDGSYKFAKNKRWDFFPALSLGWRISNEDFFKNNSSLSFVDDLKIKASYGKLGNDAAVDPFSYLSYMKFISENASVIFGETPQRALMTDVVASPDMLWEVATTYNFGLESMFLGGKLGVEFDAFYKVTSDILRKPSSYPPSVGKYYPIYVNEGIVDSRGFELTLSHNNRINDFNYRIRANVSWARSKIIKWDQSPNIPYWQKNNGRTVGQKEGFIALGLFQSEEEIANSAVVAGKPTRPGDIKYKDLNGDGKITYDQDRTFIGKSNYPELIAGLNLGADWRGFDFSALFQGGAMSDVALMGSYYGVGWDNTQFTRPFYGGGNSPVYLMEGAWRPDNPNAKYPRLTLEPDNNGYANTLWLIDGSYVRLKSVQLGYSIPRRMIQKIGADNLRLYVSGSNLFTLSHMPYIDPEAPDVNNGYYPQQKTYSIGLNITF